VTTIPILLLAFFVIGLVARRHVVIVVPLLASSMYFVGVHKRWWGDAPGEGWETAMLFAAWLGALGTMLGVMVGRTFR
jgi:hypothetical protein